jgi:hypothetical protein
MMGAMAATTQTREPLPDGHGSVTVGGTCRTCSATEMCFGTGGDSPWTRSAEPGPDGNYVVQAHRDWCPAWTGRQPEIGCPYPIGRDERCGAPISRFESRPGWWLVVPGAGPNLTDGHLRAADEAQRHHPGAGRVRAPMFDEVTVHPCGHVVEDEDARVLLARWGEARAAQQRRVAEERIALHADLLAATESAGHGALVDAYRRAVLAGDGTEAGLLVALRTVASDA